MVSDSTTSFDHLARLHLSCDPTLPRTIKKCHDKTASKQSQKKKYPQARSSSRPAKRKNNPHPTFSTSSPDDLSDLSTPEHEAPRTSSAPTSPAPPSPPDARRPQRPAGASLSSGRLSLSPTTQDPLTRIPKRYYHPSWGEQLAHKLPLAYKCGYIRKLVLGANGSRVTHLQITGMPGGAKAFDLVITFWYGINSEITTDNFAMLHCAAEHLEMTEEYKPGNLIGRTEAYLEEVALVSLRVRSPRSAGPGPRSSSRRPIDKVQIISRCIDAIATMTCGDGSHAGLDGGYDGVGTAPSRQAHG